MNKLLVSPMKISELITVFSNKMLFIETFLILSFESFEKSPCEVSSKGVC
jgi:hypothetical protein